MINIRSSSFASSIQLEKQTISQQIHGSKNQTLQIPIIHSDSYERGIRYAMFMPRVMDLMR